MRHRIYLAGLIALVSTGHAGVASAQEPTDDADRWDGCPLLLEKQLGGHAPICRLLSEGRLASGLGNADVAYRLYRWIPTPEEPSEEPFDPRYDEPPYNQIGVTLALAEPSDSPPFWADHHWLGVGWFETPYLATHDQYGEFLVVPGRIAGTGSFIEDAVLMPTMARGWQPIEAGQLNQETGGGWASQLREFIPEGSYIAKGILVDYATLSGQTAVWRRDDPNCCPSGGRLSFRLKLDGPGPRLVVAEALYAPPE